MNVNNTMKDRLFTVRWNNAKCVHIKNYEERFGMHQCVGTHYATGVVTLDTGIVFTTMSEMEYHLQLTGTMELVYHDEQQQKAS